MVGSHDSREEACAAANKRAAELKGEAFLADGEGDILDRKWYGELPRDINI